MNNFAAIDLETANQYHSSVCSVGVVIVHNSEIVDSIYRLISPQPNFYCRWATNIHSITKQDTLNALEFPDAWAEIANALLHSDFF